MSSDTLSATLPGQSTSSGVSFSVTQASTGVTTAPGTTVVSTSSQPSATSESSATSSSVASSSTTASSITSASSSSVVTSESSTTSSSQSFSSTRVVTIAPSTTTDPSSTSVVSTPSSSSTSVSSTSESSLVPVTTSSSTSVASSTGAGGTIYRTTVLYTYISSTRTGTSTSRVTGLAGSSGSNSKGGTNTGAIVGGVVGGVGGLALLAAAAFFLLKKRKKARATALDEKMFDPGYGRSNSIDLLGDSANATGRSPIEGSHISPFTGGHDPSAYASAAAAAGLGTGAAGAYALHNRGYGSSAGDAYDNMTTTGGGSSFDDHTSYTHGMQPMSPYAGYPSNAAYPSPALNRTDYAPDFSGGSMRNPRWSGGWGVAAMGGLGNDGQNGPYPAHEHAGIQPYPIGAPTHARSPSDVEYIAPTPHLSAGAAAKHREAQAEQAAYAPHNVAGPSGAPTSPPAGRSSIVSSGQEHGQGDGGSLPGSDEAMQAEELPPTYTSIRPEESREQ